MTTFTLNSGGGTLNLSTWMNTAGDRLRSSAVGFQTRTANDKSRNSNQSTTQVASETASIADSLNMTDEQLVIAYREGDRNAFASLVERYQRDLLHFLMRFLGSRAAADDVFQDTFLQIHLSLDSFDETRRFKPWLFTIAANKARDYHRRNKRRSAVSLSTPIGHSDGREAQMVDLLQGELPEADEQLLGEERGECVARVVDSMPAHYREILLLSYFQRMSYSQISESLEIPLGTVKSRLHAAVANFADAWKAAQGITPTGGDNSET